MFYFWAFVILSRWGVLMCISFGDPSMVCKTMVAKEAVRERAGRSHFSTVEEDIFHYGRRKWFLYYVQKQRNGSKLVFGFCFSNFGV